MTTLYNTFQNCLIQYAGYTGATGGIVVPPAPPAGGNTQYYTGVPASIPSGTDVIVYSLPLQGQVGDVFTMFLSGFYGGGVSNATITVELDGSNNMSYDAIPVGGGSYMFELTVRVVSASQAFITTQGVCSASFTPTSAQNSQGPRFGAGTRSMNIVAGVPMNVKLTHTTTIQVGTFSIFKFASA